MLLLGSRLQNMSVMSLQTGGSVGVTAGAIIDPAQLAVIAYKVDGPLVRHAPHYIRLQDVRELSDIGLIIDSLDELIVAGDVIKFDDIVELGFPLLHMAVMDETGKKLGKIADYTIDTLSFDVQQLTVKRPLMHRVNDTELLIHRSQIIEINDEGIVVHSQAKAPEHTATSTPGSYVNPFRKSNPAAQNSSLD